jgi:hypothetical protein
VLLLVVSSTLDVERVLSPLYRGSCRDFDGTLDSK